jgi:membrane protein YdbS with pleckstrin-like domain
MNLLNPFSWLGLALKIVWWFVRTAWWLLGAWYFFLLLVVVAILVAVGRALRNRVQTK